MHPNETFICSFDICSLLSNVPLVETIQICSDALYGCELIPPDYPWEIFVELMNTATKLVESSFNNNMYKQIDGLAMGNALSDAFANIFLDIIKANFLSPQTSHSFITDMWMTILPFLDQRKMHFFS